MDETPPPLYTQNPQQRFSTRVEDYVKYRPSYPTVAIAQILTRLQQPLVADVGAGTGISARQLAEQGAQVWAIEPNATMRDAAVPHERVTFQSGSAEQTGLADHSVDVVTCCQSFHWFEPQAALAEFHRILKPSGRVAVMWNQRDETDPFTHEHSEIIWAVGDQRFLAAGDRKSATPLAESPLFQNFQTYAFPSRQPLNLDGLIGLALSASYIPKQGAAYEQMIQEFQNLYERWVGRVPPGEAAPTGGEFVSLAYRTRLYVADSVGHV